MPLNFRTIAIVAATLCFALAAVWLFAPNLLLSFWGVKYTYPVGLVARRGAALFFAVGTIFFLARGSEPSSSRLALSYGFATGCISLAILGTWELISGHAGIGIISAVLTELALAAVLLITARR